MRVFLITNGSAGDVVPFAQIGLELMSRGHEVTLFGFAEYGPLIPRTVQFRDISNNASTELRLRDRRLLATRYHDLYLLRHDVTWNAVLYNVIKKELSTNLLLVTANRPNCWADLFAHVQLDIPVVRVNIDLPAPLHWPLRPIQLPPGRLQHRLAGGWQHSWDCTMRSAGLNVGFHHLARIIRSIARTIPTIALWPDWICGGYGRALGMRTLGFVLPRAQKAGGEVNAKKDSQPALVFVAGTRGTTSTWTNVFAKVSAGICRDMGYPGILLGGEEPLAAPYLCDRFTWRSFAPIGAILSNAAVIVHHGGIGTAALALRSGVPQLMIPRVFAQPFTAEWFRRQGLCAVLEPQGYTIQGGAAALRSLLDRPRSGQQDLFAEMNSEASAEQLVQFLETLPRPSIRALQQLKASL